MHMSRHIIHWSLRFGNELRLDEHASHYWRKDMGMRDEITADARLMSISFKRPIMIYSADGRLLTIVRAKNV